MTEPQEEVAKLFPAMVERFQPEKANGINAVIQFDLTGDNGGQYWLRIADGRAETGTGAIDSPNMTIKAAADDYIAISTGELNPMQAFISGKIKVQGDMGLAMKFVTLFNMS